MFLLVAAACSTSAAISSASGVGGGTAPAALPVPSERYCGTVREEERVALLFNPYGFDQDYGLLLAPRTARLAREAAKTAPKSIRSFWAKYADVWHRGVELLKQAGLSRRQIHKLVFYDFTSSESVVDVLSHIGATVSGGFPSEIFYRILRKNQPHLGGHQRKLFRRYLELCGILPDSTVECGRLLTAEELGAVLGEVSETDFSQGCWWTGPLPAGTEGSLTAPELYVGVYAAEATFAWLRSVENEYSPYEPLAGVGDTAVASKFAQPVAVGVDCGPILLAQVQQRTIVVADCGSTGPTVEQLAGVAQMVATRLT